MHSASRCLGCGVCAEACPDKLIRLSDTDTLTIDRDSCCYCGACVEACPGEAMRLAGREISLEQALEEIENEKHFYRHSGGGVTLSGGEPLAQPEFAEAILAACRRRGIHGAIETCGYATFDIFERIAKLADTLYFDLKHIDNAAHEKLTQAANHQIKENLARISVNHTDLIVRIPIVPGMNTDESDMIALGDFIINDTSATRLEFINYHKLGVHKYANLGRRYALEAIDPLDSGTFRDLCRSFAARFPTLRLHYHA